MQYAAGCLWAFYVCIAFIVTDAAFFLLFNIGLSYATIPLVCVICIIVAVNCKSPRLLPPVREPLIAFLLPFTIRKAAIILGVHLVSVIVIEIIAIGFVLGCMSAIRQSHEEVAAWIMFVGYFSLAFLHHVVAVAFLVSCLKIYRRTRHYGWKIQMV